MPCAKRLGSCVLQTQEEPRTEELASRTSSSSVDLLKAFVQQRNMDKNGGSLSDAMDVLGEDYSKKAVS